MAVIELTPIFMKSVINTPFRVAVIIVVVILVVIIAINAI